MSNILLDQTNPIVQLCIRGVQAEMHDQIATAQAAYQQAWSIRQTALDGCIAAHYCARHQPPMIMLEWNQIALEQARLVEHAAISDFLPSLYLNLAWSYEQTGQLALAVQHYQLCLTSLIGLEASLYHTMIQESALAALQRLDR
ncbi:rRNA adenine methyltransferase [Herpetosiphon sp. NSE202]|uniref:rRNA adenine methyltransferase n=1 Tax=Herpetosiphon sp. NSE202 TaxID=3351349 RepID=UPI003626D579